MPSSAPYRALGFLILCIPFSPSYADPAYDSEFDRKHEGPDVTYYNIDNKNNDSSLIRWKIGKNSYLGQTIVNGRTALGLEMGGGTYVYSINQQTLSFTIRF